MRIQILILVFKGLSGLNLEKMQGLFSPRTKKTVRVLRYLYEGGFDFIVIVYFFVKLSCFPFNQRHLVQPRNFLKRKIARGFSRSILQSVRNWKSVWIVCY